MKSWYGIVHHQMSEIQNWQRRLKNERVKESYSRYFPFLSEIMGSPGYSEAPSSITYIPER
jgi:hypothetical protein